MKAKIYFLTVITGILSLLVALASINRYDGFWSGFVTIIFALLIPLSALLWRKTRFFSFLLTLMFTIIVVRNSDQHDWSLLGWTTALTFIPLLIQAAIVFIEGSKLYGNQTVALTLVRVFVGFDLLTHCTEKLFVSQHDTGLVNYFQTVIGANTIGAPLSLNAALFMIILGGLVELFTVISLGFGLLTRAGSFICAIYLIMAEIMGGHFAIGYTWMIPGGGWEFPFYMFMVTIPFLLTNSAGPMSLDNKWKTASWPGLNIFSGWSGNTQTAVTRS